MVIDTTFNVYSYAQGGDPDSTSPTLRAYHKFMWNRIECQPITAATQKWRDSANTNICVSNKHWCVLTI